LLSFVPPEPIFDLNYCLWSCTLEQILAYPIEILNTLLSSKLKVVLLNTFCSNNLPLFDDGKHSY